MRNFRCSLGEEVDLDDPETYNYLPKTCNELDNLMFQEIGRALVYMDWFYWNEFSVGCGWEQRKRVKNLITFFADNRKDHYTDLMWLKEQVFLFQDEIENMC
jgi:hypothetical protein